MALKIVDACIACDACVETCPTEAIAAADPIYVIDASVCCECFGYHDTPSCIPSCPVDAIIFDEEITENDETLKKKFEQSRQ